MSEATKTIRLGDALVERGLITLQQVEEAIAVQQKDGRRRLLGEILVELNFCTEEHLVEALADAYGVPFARITPRLVDPGVLSTLPRDFIEGRDVLPLFKVDGVLTVAVTELANMFLAEEIGQAAGCSIQIVAALAKDIRATLERLAPDDAAVSFESLFEEATAEGSGKRLGDSRADMDDQDSDSPVVQLVNHAIHSAIREGASDIHFEPDEDEFRIRYRVDGQLIEKIHPPSRMQATIIARIKIMAGMDISERRLPQDGAIRVTSRGNPVDLRVSTLPNKFGEKAVLRIIDNRNSLISLEGLRVPKEIHESFIRLCAQPYGIILVTGPTGSGKSTTLYAMLSQINAPEVNICTVEDPIEFNLKGINQFQVHDKIGLSFAAVLRTLLRQDPDVIMVGEIRDPTTAAIAVQAALTGHLVLSTLHTNDSAGAITRLQNLAIEPYLVSAALVGIVAQRLVRRVCPDCATMVKPEPNILHAAERAGVSLEKVSRGRGCSTCNQTGFKGRMGIYEVLIPDDEMRDAIASGANLGKLRQLARASGMRTLFEYGVEKVRDGETTMEEVLRVTCS